MTDKPLPSRGPQLAALAGVNVLDPPETEGAVPHSTHMGVMKELRKARAEIRGLRATNDTLMKLIVLLSEAKTGGATDGRKPQSGNPA